MGPTGYLHSITFGDEAWIPHLSHDPSLTRGSRTNLGLVNNSARTIDVEVELFDGDGTLLGGFTQTLRNWKNVQIGKVFERVTNQVVTGRVASSESSVNFTHYCEGDPLSLRMSSG